MVKLIIMRTPLPPLAQQQHVLIAKKWRDPFQNHICVMLVPLSKDSVLHLPSSLDHASCQSPDRYAKPPKHRMCPASPEGGLCMSDLFKSQDELFPTVQCGASREQKPAVALPVLTSPGRCCASHSWGRNAPFRVMIRPNGQSRRCRGPGNGS